MHISAWLSQKLTPCGSPSTTGYYLLHGFDRRGVECRRSLRPHLHVCRRSPYANYGAHFRQKYPKDDGRSVAVLAVSPAHGGREVTARVLVVVPQRTAYERELRSSSGHREVYLLVSNGPFVARPLLCFSLNRPRRRFSSVRGTPPPRPPPAGRHPRRTSSGPQPQASFFPTSLRISPTNETTLRPRSGPTTTISSGSSGPSETSVPAPSAKNMSLRSRCSLRDAA